MREMTLIRVPNYTMKLRLYPSEQQKQLIDEMIRAVHVAYNITFHYVFQKDPRVCTEPKEDGTQWPDFKKMAEKPWLEFLRAENPVVKKVPAAALSTKNGVFLHDAKAAWDTGMHKRPIDPDMRREFHFYSAAKPRRSFFCQMGAEKLALSPTNEKVAWITIPNMNHARIKARGFNPRLRFGRNGELSYTEALAAKALPGNLSMRVSKDRCGDYYAIIAFVENESKGFVYHLQVPASENPQPIGVDAGVTDIAALSNGQKIENKKFLKQKQPALSRLNRALSRRWGPANGAYRDYQKAIRQENRKLPQEDRQPLAQPSQRYRKAQQKKALIERKVARRRDTYYHQQTAALVRQSSLIATETLHVSNMMRNHRLAHALSDAAMSSFLAKIDYKAKWHQVPLLCVGAFEATSQLCSQCGQQNPALRSLSIRRWVCPSCGAKHDRDINAAKNILRIAMEKGGTEDQVKKEKPKAEAQAGKPPGGKRPRRQPLPEHPGVEVVYSKQLTRLNDPRYVVVDAATGAVLDDGQGAGYRTAAKARNAYKAKKAWAQKAHEQDA